MVVLQEALRPVTEAVRPESLLEVSPLPIKATDSKKVQDVTPTIPGREIRIVNEGPTNFPPSEVVYQFKTGESVGGFKLLKKGEKRKTGKGKAKDISEKKQAELARRKARKANRPKQRTRVSKIH